ncbi:hypothetical protein [Nocardia sp. NPDC005366]|uniref:hypothetical protein n=1 Tax=Nocardia sp. NPDC005366 TaxID=3156878 RepID=UPI0033A34B5C
MRARHRGLLAVSLALTTLLGCSAEQDMSEPAAPSAAVATFGVRVPAVDLHKLQVADQVRQIDPCGFFDSDEFAAYGEVTSSGPDRGLDDCTVGLTPKGRTRSAGRATIALTADQPGPDETETRQVAGETVVVDRAGTGDAGCAFKVPLRLPGSVAAATSRHDGEVGTVQWARVEGTGFDTSALDCQAATEAAAAMVSALRDNRIPRRDESAVEMTLADRSPCELMSGVPAGYTISRFDAQTRPYTCSFRVDGSSAGRYGSTVTVDFLLQAADGVLDPGEGRQAVAVAGRSALREESPQTGSCFISMTAGPVIKSVASSAQSGTGTARSQVVVRVFAGSCAVADQFAAIAAEMFGANR